MGEDGSQPQLGPGPGVQPHHDPGVPPHQAALQELRADAVPGEAVPSLTGHGEPVPGQPVSSQTVPSEPVKVGVDAVGTVPQTSAARVWSRAQLLNWRLLLVRFLVAGVAVVVTVALVPGLRFRGWEWGEFVQIAVIFGLLNVTVKPLLQFLSLRFIFNTYGLVVVLINAVVLGLLGWLMPDRFQAERPVALVTGGLVVGVLGLVLETLLGANQPVLDREYRERNSVA